MHSDLNKFNLRWSYGLDDWTDESIQKLIDMLQKDYGHTRYTTDWLHTDEFGFPEKVAYWYESRWYHKLLPFLPKIEHCYIDNPIPKCIRKLREKGEVSCL